MIQERSHIAADWDSSKAEGTFRKRNAIVIGKPKRGDLYEEYLRECDEEIDLINDRLDAALNVIEGKG